MSSATYRTTDGGGINRLQYRNPLLIVGSSCAILLSLKALLSWLFPVLPLLNYESAHYSNTQFLFALIIITEGSCFLLLAGKQARFALYASLGACALATLMLAQAAFPILSDGSMASLSNLMVAGTALLSSTSIALITSGRPSFRWALPVFLSTAALLLTIAQILLVFALWPFSDGYKISLLNAPAPPIVIGSVAIAITTIIAAFTGAPEDELLPSPWPAAAAGFLVVVLGYGVWLQMSHWQVEQYRKALQIRAESVSLEISSLIDQSNNWLSQLAYQVGSQQNDQQGWRSGIRVIAPENTHLSALFLVDRQLQARLISDQHHTLNAGESISLHSVPGLARKLEQSARSGTVLQLAQRTELNTADQYLVFAPLVEGGTHLGYLAGVVDMRKMLNILLDRQHYRAHLEHVGIEVNFGPVAGPKIPASERLRADWEFHQPIGDPQLNWSITLWPSPERLREMRSFVPEITFFAAFAMMLFTVNLVSSNQTRRLRSLRIRSINTTLQEEVHQRTIVQEELAAAHAALSVELERVQSILDNSTDIIISVSGSGKVLSINRAGESALGYRSSELVGKHFLILLPPRLKRRKRELLQALHDGSYRTGPEQRSATIILITRDKRRMYGQFTVSSTHLDEDSQFTTFIRDVTAQREYEKALRKARLVAEDASKQKSSFLANMSHEIRTPMNGIIGMCALLKDSELNAQQADYLRTIQGSADSLLNIINDILDFSKVEAGKLHLESIEFNMREELEGLNDLLSLLSRDKGLALLLRIAPGTPLMYRGDPVRLRQIITNFVNNAIKFTSSGHVLIDVSAKLGMRSMATVRFRVEDTGIGIPPDKFAEIFRDFTQADTSTTRQYGGTGLGLTIAKRLTEMMDGHISVESQPGRGTCFNITLNLPYLPGLSEPNISPLLNDRHVMLVDGSDIARQTTCEQLQAWHMKVEEFVDPGNAYAALLEAAETDQRFHLVIAEKELPHPGGFSLGQQIHSDPELRRTPLLMLTSKPQLGDGKRSKESGFHGYLPRPSHERDLHDVIAKLLELDLSADQDSLQLVTRLSIADDNRALGIRQSGQAASGNAPLPNLSGRVLLAEDNLVNQKVAQKMLEKLGCSVVIAQNGKEAVEKWRDGKFDLILMDCQMPELDGYDATRTIRSEENTGHHIPILALTANAMSSDRAKCLEAGMDEHLPKPVKMQQLSTVMERFLLDA